MLFNYGSQYNAEIPYYNTMAYILLAFFSYIIKGLLFCEEKQLCQKLL